MRLHDAKEHKPGTILAPAKRSGKARNRSRKLIGPLACAASAMIVKYMLNYSASLDLMFQALADPTRRVMVERLSRGPASVSELAKPLAMSLPAGIPHPPLLEASGPLPAP